MSTDQRRPGRTGSRRRSMLRYDRPAPDGPAVRCLLVERPGLVAPALVPGCTRAQMHAPGPAASRRVSVRGLPQNEHPRRLSWPAASAVGLSSPRSDEVGLIESSSWWLGPGWSGGESGVMDDVVDGLLVGGYGSSELADPDGAPATNGAGPAATMIAGPRALCRSNTRPRG